MSTATTESPGGIDLTRLLGLAPSSPRLTSLLTSLSTSPSSPPTLPPPPELKSYPDIVYFNYHSLGLSISFEPTTKSYKPRYNLTSISQLEPDKLSCTGIDIYNHEATSSDPYTAAPTNSVKPTYSPFPNYPLLLPSPTSSSSSSSIHFPLVPTTNGKELVSVYGEPTRKGGGDTKGLGIWTEWLQEGIMVEWASGGLGAWDKGGESVWKVVSLFEPGNGKGKEEND